jgi:hypothetical protein
MFKKIIISSLLFFSFYSVSYAEDIFVLYGFKIGQKSSIPVRQFGNPIQTYKFEDGFSYNVFKMKDHVVVFESDNTRPDLIWSIQIQGESNPQYLGLNGINLGDKVSEVIKVFGKPDKIEEATDEKTKKPIKNIDYYSYDESSNFSIEVTDKIVTSIKISFKGPNKTKDPIIDFNKFLSTVRSNDLNKISNYIDPDFELRNKETFLIDTSVIEALNRSKEINSIFFNSDYGIITITDKDIAEASMRVQTNPDSAGYVFKIKKNKMRYELYFEKSYEGWVLKYINQY